VEISAMKFWRLILVVVFATQLSACLFIKQARESKMNTPIVVEDDDLDEGNIFTKEEIEPQPTPKVEPIDFQRDTTIIWHHPNPWWKVKTAQFPVSADSMKYRMFRPQYGFTEFTNQKNQREADTWNLWQAQNQLYNDMSYGGHMYGAVI